MFLRLQLWLAVLGIFCITLPALNAQVAETVASSQEKAGVQLEARQSTEVTFTDAEQQDQAFDEQLVSKEAAPEAVGGPDQSTVEKLLSSSALSAAPSEFNVDQAVQGLRSRSSRGFCRAYSYRRSSSCCRKSDNYGCRSTRQCMPCFWHYQRYFLKTGPLPALEEHPAALSPVKRSVPFPHYSRRQWCCPIWPRQYISNCSCSKCFSLKTYGVQSGTCQRRYTRRTFFAACYSYGRWYGQFITKYIPTSCYCRLNNSSGC